MNCFKGAIGSSIVLAALAAAIGWSTVTVAQTYPSQAVRIIVPFSAGSATDILARIVADKMQERWGQNVIVENICCCNTIEMPITSGCSRSIAGFTRCSNTSR